MVMAVMVLMLNMVVVMVMVACTDSGDDDDDDDDAGDDDGDYSGEETLHFDNDEQWKMLVMAIDSGDVCGDTNGHSFHRQ